MTEEEMNKFIENLGFDFVEMLEEKDMEILMVDIRNELLIDQADMTIHRVLRSYTKEQEKIIIDSYISKYSLFIWNFQTNEEYEKCAEVRDMITDTIQMIYKIKRDKIMDDVAFCVSNYNERLA